jgi:flagellar M-ring protein FliF
MDFVNQLIAQMSALFRSMTPGARITAALLLAVVVVSLGYLFRQGTAGPDAYLFGGEPLSDGQLTRVEAAIAQAKLQLYPREGNRLRVPAGQQAAYLAAVADAGALPPNFNTILESALEKGGPWESREQTRERLKIAKEQRLTEIVRAHYWVEDAAVLYDEQQTRGARELGGTRRITASVNVKPIVGETLTPPRIKNLQKLVAHAVNMDASDVNVNNLGEGGSYGGDGGIFYDIFDDEYNQTRIAYEMQKRESILQVLGDIPGARVEVNAELDKTVEESSRNVKPDTKTALRRETDVSQESSQTTMRGGGQPGAVAQGPTRQGATETASQNQNETKNKTLDSEFVVGMEERRVLQRGYTPKEVWATVTLPSSYIESVWQRRNPTAPEPPKPEELIIVRDEVVKQVENAVEPLLLLQANKGQDTYKWVRVVVLDSLPAPKIEPPSVSSQALAWTSRYWTTLAMLGVAMFSLLVLRGVVKAAPNNDSSVASAPPTLKLEADEGDGVEDSDESSADDRPRLRLKKNKSVKDDLVEIVREDPDAAADILRSWISKAG